MKLQLQRNFAVSCVSAPKGVVWLPPRQGTCHILTGQRVLARAGSADETKMAMLGNVSIPLQPQRVEPKLSPKGSMFDLSDEEEDTEAVEDCKVFIDRDGDFLPVMCCDYGFRSGSMRMYNDTDGRIPVSFFSLAVANFKQELKGIRRSFRYDEYSTISELNPSNNPLTSAGRFVGAAVVKGFSGLDQFLESINLLSILTPKEMPPEMLDESGNVSSSCADIQSRLRELKLSNDAVWDREHKREAEGGAVDTPWFVKFVYLSLCVFLDVMFDGRPIQRFWFLETVARMPYFSYITMLHFYETLGWWRAGAELRKVHFAEEWNEMHHLSIMESLGGDQLWVDRFLGQHSAILYYIVLCIMFIFAPSLAYNFSELIEAHAVDTYGEFVDANEELLKELPPPYSAASYYRSPDLYMFDEFQTASRGGAPRRPQCNNLYDVFCNIRDDEGEHVKTMKACQDMSVVEELVTRRDNGRSV